MFIGKVEIRYYHYFDSLFRQFLDKLVCYFGNSICGWKLLNYAYKIDNDMTYYIREGGSYGRRGSKS